MRLKTLPLFLIGLLFLAGCSGLRQIPVVSQVIPLPDIVPGPSIGRPEEEAPPGAPLREFFIVAQRFRFEPGTIMVNKGDIVKLTIKSIDTIHGFKINQPKLKINKTLYPNKAVTVTIYARKRGLIEFFCSRFCGIGHFWHRGKIVVK